MTQTSDAQFLARETFSAHDAVLSVPSKLATTVQGEPTQACFPLNLTIYALLLPP